MWGNKSTQSNGALNYLKHPWIQYWWRFNKQPEEHEKKRSFLSFPKETLLIKPYTIIPLLLFWIFILLLGNYVLKSKEWSNRNHIFSSRKPTIFQGHRFWGFVGSFGLKPYVRSKGRKFERARGRRRSCGFKVYNKIINAFNSIFINIYVTLKDCARYWKFSSTCNDYQYGVFYLSSVLSKYLSLYVCI